jgi:acetolactate synthase I/II/III large subunit
MPLGDPLHSFYEQEIVKVFGELTFTSRSTVADPVETSLLPSPPVDDDQIDRAAKLISTSRRPMIFAGSGAIGAADAVRQLAEMIDAPVVFFRSGRGVVSNDHPLRLTIVQAYGLWDKTDLAIGIGTRMEVPGWRWGYRPQGQKTVRIDVEPAEMRRRAPDVSVIADARPAVESLIAAVTRCGFTRTVGRRQEFEDAAAPAMQTLERELQPQMSYLPGVAAGGSSRRHRYRRTLSGRVWGMDSLSCL